MTGMIEQESFEEEKIYRFELIPNTMTNAYNKAFNLYGILIIPILLGSFLMYNIFELREKYFITSFLLMVFTLGNIYFFYHRLINKTSILKLIVYSNCIQIFDGNQICFQENIEQLEIKMMICGNPVGPAIRISNEDFQGIIIGWKNTENNNHINIKNKLIQPDYWLRNKEQSNTLMDILKHKIVTI